MESLFEAIINNLREGNSINEVTNQIKLVISNGNLDTSDIFLAFIKYLKSHYLNENNFETFSIIDNYFNNQISLQQLAKETFLKKIVVDQDKRDGHQPQFRHNSDETFLDEIFRVIYEFTRNDLVMPKGVCYDFCLFITGLSIAKKDKKRIYIWNSIEKSSGENNFILFCIEEDNVIVYDPFNGVYLPLEKYDIASVGFKLIELESNNILKESIGLTGFNQGITYYEDIIKRFSFLNKNTDNELELLKRQNYYQRLSVDNNATFDDIKKSFRKQIAKYHPDINSNDKYATEKTQLIIEAYDCLKSDSLRREYDSKIIQSNSTRNEPQKSSDNTQTDTINFDEELEKIIREFKKKYHVDSYKDILELLTRMTRKQVRQESDRSDLKYNNCINNINRDMNNIYNINNINININNNIENNIRKHY